MAVTSQLGECQGHTMGKLGGMGDRVQLQLGKGGLCPCQHLPCPEAPLSDCSCAAVPACCKVLGGSHYLLSGICSMHLNYLWKPTVSLVDNVQEKA